MTDALIFTGGVICGLSVALGLIWNARREVARMIEAERELGVKDEHDEKDGGGTVVLTE